MKVGLRRVLAAGALSVFLCGCGDHSASTGASTSSAPNAEFPIYTYQVVNSWPHDRGAFTQGLIYHEGELLESTGLNGRSSLRRVELQTGKVLQQVNVPYQYFAEGLALLNGKLFQLTWQNHKGFVYDLNSFKFEKEFSYQGEGWGLTSDGQNLIMSDGTSQIRFLDPVTFEVKRTINVLARGQPVKDALDEPLGPGQFGVIQVE